MEASFANQGKLGFPLVAGSHSGNEAEYGWGLQNIVLVNYTIVIDFGRLCCFMMFVKDR